MPVNILYNLEVNEDELALLWATLTFLKHHPGPKPTHQVERDADAAADSALDKVERLMAGK